VRVHHAEKIARLTELAEEALDWERVLVSATTPQDGAFTRFGDEAMMEAGRRAMPGAPILEAAATSAESAIVTLWCAS
jgi:hypothetical protein